jgi:tRNA threonylcarbamoyl adenosine modification protein YeaZ
MRILVIDTATPACSVALFDDNDNRLLAGDYAVIGRGHAERLLPMIAELPNRGQAEMIMVNAGPGSFTGIRVGISAAKALALAWNAPCHGYSNLQLLAGMAIKSHAIDVAINGGHGEYFFQSFDSGSAPITTLHSLTPTEAATRSNAPTVVGDAATALVALRGTGVAVNLLPDARRWPCIANTAKQASSAIYGRAPDAKPPSKIEPR